MLYSNSLRSATASNTSTREIDYMTFSVFDPTLPFRFTDLEFRCGNPPWYHRIVPPLGNRRDTFATVSAYYHEDPVGALSGMGSRYCSPEVRQRKAYTYYDSDVMSIGTESPEDCSDPLVCGFALSLSFSSSLVTTQKSSRGTNALKILTDEGSLVGGILFLTWFLGIFVL